jgi:hypothetical protein
MLADAASRTGTPAPRSIEGAALSDRVSELSNSGGTGRRAASPSLRPTGASAGAGRALKSDRTGVAAASIVDVADVAATVALVGLGEGLVGSGSAGAAIASGAGFGSGSARSSRRSSIAIASLPVLAAAEAIEPVSDAREAAAGLAGATWPLMRAARLDAARGAEGAGSLGRAFVGRATGADGPGDGAGLVDETTAFGGTACREITGARVGSSAMILRMEARISSMLGSETFSELVVIASL